jgi:hypothetical protein
MLDRGVGFCKEKFGTQLCDHYPLLIIATTSRQALINLGDSAVRSFDILQS